MLTGKPTGRRRWEDNIRMDLKEIGIKKRESWFIRLWIRIIGEPL